MSAANLAIGALALSGCLSEVDTAPADLDAFHRVGVHFSSSISSPQAIGAELIARQGRPCPILENVTARLGDTELRLAYAGGIEDGTGGGCGDPYFAAGPAPTTRGASLVIASGEQTRTCDLYDLYLSQPIEFLDGTSTRVSGEQGVRWRYVEPIPGDPGLPRIWLTPVGAREPVFEIPDPPLGGDLYSFDLPDLAPQDYDLWIDRSLTYSVDGCELHAFPWTTQTLTIVAP